MENLMTTDEAIKILDKYLKEDIIQYNMKHAISKLIAHTIDMKELIEDTIKDIENLNDFNLAMENTPNTEYIRKIFDDNNYDKIHLISKDKVLKILENLREDEDDEG